MPQNSHAGRSRTGTIVIARSGTTADILEPDGTATENEYGKTESSEETFTKVAEEPARRVYNTRDDFPAKAYATGGRVDDDNPLVLLKKDTVADEGYRVSFPNGATYELDEELYFETHSEYRVTVING